MNPEMPFSTGGHPGPPGGAAGRAAGETSQSLWALIDDRLRGRWRFAIGLAVALSLGLAVAGWRSTGPLYRSTGVVRVAPRVPVTLEAIPEVELSQFGMFVNTQVQLLHSRRVLENALDHQALAALPWSKRPDVLDRLESNLEVTTGRNSELIYVSFESESAAVAEAAVNAVMGSYYDIYGQAGGHAVGETINRLRGVEARFQRELQQVRGDITRLHHRWEAADLVDPQALLQERLVRLQQLIAAAEESLAQGGAADGEAGDTVLGEPSPRILERLEAIDPNLAELRRQRDAAERAYNAVRRRYRPGTGAYTIARREYDTARALFEDGYFAALQTWEQVPGAREGGPLEDLSFAGFSVARLRNKIEAMREQEAALRQQSRELLADARRLGDLELQQERVQGDLDRTRRRIQSLQLEEQNIAARVSVEQEGFRPRSASSDKRRKRALFGAVAGAGLSFGLFFLWGTVDRRAYGARQLSARTTIEPVVLGVLPDLGRSALDAESTDVAAHCVHQIRNQIEATRDPRPGFVLAVSSPFQGDGKTSIVLALGWSYAVAGYRTLVMDCDLVGRSLTRQLGLVGRPGLREALMARDPAGLVAPVGDGTLDAVPVGVDPRFGPESVRKIDLVEVLDRLRERYDMIVIDTGPLLGSLESTPVSAAVDGVVLSVRRGRSRSRLDECATRLSGVGASCLGVILNCAARSDCHRYVSDASLAGTVEERVRRGQPTTPDPALQGRNALVMAMEMTARRHEAEAASSRVPVGHGSEEACETS